MRSCLKVIGANIGEKKLRMMMKWRINNQNYYVEQPTITFKSFKKWFKKYYVEKKRLLFFVVNRNGKAIGHMGIAEMRGNSCKLDNIIRGEHGSKGLMTKALHELLDIVMRMFKHVYVKVKSDNIHAIEFYKRNGFVYKEKTQHRGLQVDLMEYDFSYSSHRKDN